MADAERQQDLDSIFEVLFKRQRREIICAVSLQLYSIGQLAALWDLSLPAIHKHINGLAGADLVQQKVRETNFIVLRRRPLRNPQDWVMYRGRDSKTLESYAHGLGRNQTRKETSK